MCMALACHHVYVYGAVEFDPAFVTVKRPTFTSGEDPHMARRTRRRQLLSRLP